MAYNERVANRVREVLASRKSVAEIRMMGGLCFTLRGHMCCGVLKDDLVVRVGFEGYESALAEPHARPMDFTGRPLKGFVFVGPDGYKTARTLARWVLRAIDFAASLPAKQTRAITARTSST